jgi:hypothetical protein
MIVIGPFAEPGRLGVEGSGGKDVDVARDSLGLGSFLSSAINLRRETD